jgi:hypothetical protein
MTDVRPEPREQRAALTDYRIVSQAPVLRHLTARLEPSP